MSARPLHILYEDNHLLVVNKPAGLPTMGVQAGRDSLVSQAKRYIKDKYDKPGNVYLGVVSRLDSLVSGAIVLARTSKAAARLTAQFQSRDVTKIYWAVVERPVEPRAGECEDWVQKDDRRHRMVIVEPGGRGQQARLRYRTLGSLRGGNLLEIELLTGRKHQIRLQLAARRAPVLGDRKYGAVTSFAPGIALHSRRLALLHPVRKSPLEFTAPVPRSWQQLGRLPSGV